MRAGDDILLFVTGCTFIFLKPLKARRDGNTIHTVYTADLHPQSEALPRQSETAESEKPKAAQSEKKKERQI